MPSVVELVIERHNLAKGLAFAQTPEGEVAMHIRDARIPLYLEGSRLPFLGNHRLFLHSDRHLPRKGDKVIAHVRPAANTLRAAWCPLDIWERACRRYEIVRVEHSGGESTVWQGDGILMLSLLFHSGTYFNGIISTDAFGTYRLVDITDEDEIAPRIDPRLKRDMLPHDLMDNFPSWI
ncbi:MAG TPA: hypothetical protein VJ843_04195 [Candidatus Saccharimonadales bacterium]|nr:hypothetical protein [Candidatus Saccharimonadales bacterium]